MHTVLKIFLALVLIKQVQAYASTCPDVLGSGPYPKAFLQDLDRFDFVANGSLFEFRDRKSGVFFSASLYIKSKSVLGFASGFFDEEVDVTVSVERIVKTVLHHYRYAVLDEMRFLIPVGKKDVMQTARFKMIQNILAAKGFTKTSLKIEDGVQFVSFTKPDIYEAGLERATDHHFEWTDPSNPNFNLTASLYESVLNFYFRLKSEDGFKRSKAQGSVLFQMMVDHFGLHRIVEVEHSKHGKAGLATYWSNVNDHGMSYITAARQTWTARFFAKHGFTKIVIEDPTEFQNGQPVHFTFKRSNWRVETYRDAILRRVDLRYLGE